MIKQNYEFKIIGSLNHYLSGIENDKKSNKIKYIYKNLSFEIFCILIERLYYFSKNATYQLHETIYGVDFVKLECLNIFNNYFLSNPKDIWSLKKISKNQMMNCYNEIFQILNK